MRQGRRLGTISGLNASDGVHYGPSCLQQARARSLRVLPHRLNRYRVKSASATTQLTQQSYTRFVNLAHQYTVTVDHVAPISSAFTDKKLIRR